MRLQGDRRTNYNLQDFNYDSKTGQQALRLVYKAIMEVSGYFQLSRIFPCLATCQSAAKIQGCPLFVNWKKKRKRKKALH